MAKEKKIKVSQTGKNNLNIGGDNSAPLTVGDSDIIHENDLQNTKPKKLSMEIKVAITSGLFLLIATIITIIFNGSSKEKGNAPTQTQVNNQSINLNNPNTDTPKKIIQSKEIKTIKPKIMDNNQPKSDAKKDTVPKVSQTGKNNLNISGDNKGTVNVGDTYNTPPQRHAEKRDIDQIVDEASDKNMKISVCSNGSKEGTTFRSEILKKLSELGYTNLRVCTIGMSEGVWGEGRITIHRRNYAGENYLQVALNPQE